jgi:glucose-6-phosphate isomerase/transaldolase/glucose-6-phosphate isomerase
LKPSYEPAAHLATDLLKADVVNAIWGRDIAAWGAQSGSADAKSIGTRLGWLNIGTTMAPHIDRLKALRERVHAEHIEAVYLLGMGGSSLCAEVLRSVFGIAPGFPELLVLDTTDEHTLTTAADRMTPERTWFVVASKSGGTVEVASMEKFFWARMQEAIGTSPGKHFIAVTDPGTALDTMARAKGYADVFVNPADIGGRFSALSLFGLVPAALIGAPFEAILNGGATMAEGCRQSNHANAGLELGAFIAAAALEGRDKLTVALAPRLAALGLWIEQLVAESTGKHGKGSLPVVDEPLGGPDAYGNDRAFVAVSSESEHVDEQALSALEAAGHPVLRLSTRIDGLGAEFFRWEFATAVAGAALGINPFDEPNVSEAKEKTNVLLAKFASAGRFEDTPAPASTIVGELKTALAHVEPPDYVAFLSYLPADRQLEEAIREIRASLRGKRKVASTFGVGPRYLHSTGQYHKGGPNTCVAVVITGDDTTQTEIPEAGYSFSVLKRAQALGDVEALRAHKRRVVRIDLGSTTDAAVALRRIFEDALR